MLPPTHTDRQTKSALESRSLLAAANCGGGGAGDLRGFSRGRRSVIDQLQVRAGEKEREPPLDTARKSLSNSRLAPGLCSALIRLRLRLRLGSANRIGAARGAPDCRPPRGRPLLIRSKGNIINYALRGRSDVVRPTRGEIKQVQRARNRANRFSLSSLFALCQASAPS